MQNFPFHIYFEALSLLSCIIFWGVLKQNVLRWFLPYLGFIVVVEILGWYLPFHLRASNTWLFNISIPVEYLFFSFIFYYQYEKRINKKIVIGFIGSFFVYVLYYSFFKGLHNFNTYYLLAGSFVMIVFCVLFFSEQYKKTSTENIWENPLFWIGTGVLLFNAGEFSYNFLSRFIVKNNLDPTIRVFRMINNKLIILFYLLITAGIICQKITKQFKTA